MFSCSSRIRRASSGNRDTIRGYRCVRQEDIVFQVPEQRSDLPFHESRLRRPKHSRSIRRKGRLLARRVFQEGGEGHDESYHQ